MELNDWVKKLGQWHLYISGDSKTLCNMPMLGNNYKKSIEEKKRRPCKECFQKNENLVKEEE
jgi:hypothetical protein